MEDDREDAAAERVAELQDEVDVLTDELATLEAELAEMREALDQFEVRYRQLIAGRLAALESLQAELEALRGQDAAAAEARAEEAARVAEEPTPKERYRSLIRRIHPDRFGHDPELEDVAEELTKRLTDAWDRRDIDEIDRIEAEVERRFPGDQPPSVRVKILARLRNLLIGQIDGARAAAAELRDRALWALLERSEEESAEGRDMLAEQAAELDAAAAMLQEEIDSLRGHRSS